MSDDDKHGICSQGVRQCWDCGDMCEEPDYLCPCCQGRQVRELGARAEAAEAERDEVLATLAAVRHVLDTSQTDVAAELEAAVREALG